MEQLEVLESYKSGIVLGDIRLSRIDFISALFACSNVRARLLERLQMTEQEELFAGFFSSAYNKGKDIDKMTFTELDAWLIQLEKIVFEAKATLQGASQARREREANLKSSERDKIRNADGSFDTSNAINVVTKRKDRMSKRDKLEESYRALGIPEADIQSLLSNIKVDETFQTKPSVVGPLSGQVFNGSPKPIDTCPNCEQDYEAGTKHDCPKKKNLLDKIVDSVLNAKPIESKPFDASSLFPVKAEDKPKDKE
jgi:hypothetical protein